MSVMQQGNSDPKKGILLTVFLGFSAVALFLGAFVYEMSKPTVLTVEELRVNGVFLYDTPRSFKDFSLLDYHNEAFTQDAFQGKWSLVFFGFTFCPDICPTTMALLNRFYKAQAEAGLVDDLQVIMVSVDPVRDTPDKLLPYVQFFNKEFMGVTGEFLDIHRFATQLNIPFAKVPGGGENYTVDHSGNIAIINPHGHYVGFFRPPLTLSQLNLTYPSIREARQ